MQSNEGCLEDPERGGDRDRLASIGIQEPAAILAMDTFDCRS